MCTLALYLRQFDDYPLVVAANRDEYFSRPSEAPQLLAKDPPIFGGKDLVAGGTWFGVNAYGMVAGIVNRRMQTSARHDTARSRGLLCLDLLRAKDVVETEKLLENEDGSKYPPFLLLIARAAAAFVAFNSEKEITRVELHAGLHVFSNTSFTDSSGGKLGHARDLFSKAGASLRTQLADPKAPLDTAVGILRGVLSSHDSANESQETRDAICVHTDRAVYGTVSSSIVFYARREKRFYFYHAAGAPCRSNYEAAEAPRLS